MCMSKLHVHGKAGPHERPNRHLQTRRQASLFDLAKRPPSDSSRVRL